MFGNDRTDIRRMFLSAWEKRTNPLLTLSPLEQIIVNTINLHPEYQHWFEAGEELLNKDFETGEGGANPFFHLGLHISIHEQLQTDRPPGIRNAYQRLAAKTETNHDAEHKMMECLEQALWQAQASGKEPDEKLYLRCVERAAG